MAYNIYVAAVGFMGWSKPTLASWSFFGFSDFSMIKSSANRLALAAS